MSTPPFIAMPDGVALSEPPEWPVPTLLAEPAQSHGTALLVPGFTGSKEDFLAVLAPLAALGWRAAAMDLPGQAGFPGLGPRGSHTPAALAQSVRAEIDRLDDGRGVHLVGHSMGGLVTREVVLADTSGLASWTLLCSGPGPVPAATWPSLQALSQAIGVLPMTAIWQQKEAADRAGGWTPPSDAVATFVRRRFLANDPDALADFATILMTAPDRTELAAAALATAGLPSAVVTGERDDAWPPDEQERMAIRLAVPWHLLPGVGHSPAAEDPRLAATVLHDIFSHAAGMAHVDA